MSKDGIGWPATYFVWGAQFGSYVTLMLIDAAKGRLGEAIIGMFLAFICYKVARNTTRPLFSRDD